MCRRIARLRATRLIFKSLMLVGGFMARSVSPPEGGMFPTISIPLAKSKGIFTSGYPRCLIKGMISGISSLRAGVRTGWIAASLPRIGLSLRAVHFSFWATLRPIVLTVHVFNVVLRIVVRERTGNSALIALSEGVDLRRDLEGRRRAHSTRDKPRYCRPRSLRCGRRRGKDGLDMSVPGRFGTASYPITPV